VAGERESTGRGVRGRPATICKELHAGGP
jgi:hypothetical protein